MTSLPTRVLSGRTLLAAGLVAAFAACQSTEPIVARDVPTYDAETFFATTSMFGASFSEDGRELLVTSDETGVYNAYAFPVEGGPPRALTSSTTDAVMTIGWFPEDDRFLYRSDEGGNELTHLYVQEEDGRVIDLTPGENLKASFAGWNRAKTSFYAVTNERDPQYFDLYRYDIAGATAASAGADRGGYAREMVYQNPGGMNVSAISPDGRWVALVHSRNNADSDVYLVDLENAGDEPLHVTPHEGDIAHGVADFAPDGSKLYYTSNEGHEFDRVWSYDLESQKRKVVFEDDWDVSFYSFTHDGRYLVTGVNADARTEVRLFEVESGREVRLPKLPEGDLRGVSIEPDGTRMAFYLNGDTSPSNLFLLDLESRDFERLTENLNPAIDAENLVASEVVRYESFDGLEIPALLYRPHQADANSPVPALVWVHGGPGGQSRQGYRATIQHLVNNGYAILAVNNRGSSGYGKTFFHLDDKKHGDVDLKDCIWGRRYLEGLEWVDGEKIGIIGGSYGGYMVCAALAFEPDSFEVGIDIFGVTNWLRTLESIPPWWADFRDSLYAEMGDPAEDKERLHGNSPLFHASQIEKPMLVVQGANDPRVLQVESDEMVAAVRANGVPVEYVLFDDEGHGFQSRKNRIAASTAYVEFLDEYLKGD